MGINPMNRLGTVKTSLSTSVDPLVAERILTLTSELKQTKSKLIYALLLVGLDHLDELNKKLTTI
jgi:hypothetical protein